MAQGMCSRPLQVSDVVGQFYVSVVWLNAILQGHRFIQSFCLTFTILALKEVKKGGRLHHITNLTWQWSFHTLLQSPNIISRFRHCWWDIISKGAAIHNWGHRYHSLWDAILYQMPYFGLSLNHLQPSGCAQCTYCGCLLVHCCTRFSAGMSWDKEPMIGTKII